MTELTGSEYHSRVFKITLVVAAFLSIIFLDQTGVAVTLASIQKQLHLSSSGVAWSMNAYMISLSAFLLLFARISDRAGIKTIFCLGIFIFMLASIGCATANSASWLIASRALQGLGASMGYATYLLIFNHEVKAEDRGRVLGTSAAFAAIFLALGPLVGGFFSTVISWHYLFWLNVPICLMCLYFAGSACRQDSPVSKEWLPDRLGLLMYLIAILSLVFFLMEGSRFGWDNPYIVAAIMASLVFFILFYFYERQHATPLIEVDLFKNKRFSASIVILFGNYACVTSIAFWALWLEHVLGYSPLMSGVALLPAGVLYILGSKLGGNLYDKHGTKLPLMIGSLLFLIGFAEMAGVALTMHYIWFLFGMLVMGLGWGFVRPCAILSGLTSVSANHKSMATGMISTMRQLGAAVGFALVYAVISTYKDYAFTKLISRSHHSFSMQQLNQLLVHPGKQVVISHLLSSVKIAYTQAFSLGLFVMSFFALVNLLLVIRYI